MRSDAGASYVVYEYQEFVDAGSKGCDDWIPGLKYLDLGNGSRVNFVDENTFKIMRSGAVLRRF